MLVDDDEMIVHFFKMLLEENDYQVEAAYTGSEAIKHAENHHIDLAILDYKLSDMTGDVLAKKIKDISEETIIVFITGYSEARDKILGTNLSKHVIVKPIKDDELIATVELAFHDNSTVMKM
jgi:two-component system OmpR family response regulator